VVDGRYTGALAGPFCHGAGKVKRLADVLDAAEIAACTAYGDSYSDLPVLRAAGQPVAVNPDRALAAVATVERWPVLHFR
jgi:phosphoserine phosphatase